MNIYQLIQLDDRAATPKYLQLANAFLRALEQGSIGTDYPLPSINELSYELEISRDTAEKAFRYLKQKGVIGSFPGKGYFVQQSDFKQPIKVFLLFNKLSAHKKIIYDAFTGHLGEQAFVDLYVYNNEFALFKKLLLGRRTDYTHFVVIPHFLEGGEMAATVLDQLSVGQLILLDKWLPGVSRPFGAVFEPFERDIYHALKEALPRLSGYHTLKIIFPAHTYFPVEILKGFQTFCLEFAFQHKVVHDIESETIGSGEVYINLMEDDLVTLLEKVQETAWVVGKDIGIISYNETPWKRFILQGITTISTDFEQMGRMAAEMVMRDTLSLQEVPFTLTLRSSL